jgi:hypothetical protein
MGTVEVSIPVPMPVMNRAIMMWGTEYAVLGKVAPTYTLSDLLDKSSTRVHDDEYHRDPHCKSSTGPVAEDKGQDTFREASEFINRNNNTF